MEMMCVAAWRPYKHNFPIMQDPECDETLFTIVTSDVRGCHSGSRENLRYIIKVEATILKGHGTL